MERWCILFKFIFTVAFGFLSEQSISAISLANSAWVSKNEASYINDYQRTTLPVQHLVKEQAVPNYLVHAGNLRSRGRTYLTIRYYDSFTVIEKIGPPGYELQLPASFEIHQVFHMNQARQHVGPNPVPPANLPLVILKGQNPEYRESSIVHTAGSSVSETV
jgi:hypothetical protein